MKREGYGDGSCYAAFPSKRYKSLDIELPPPPGLVFLVFIRSDLAVMDWEWRKVDPDDPTYPKDWQNDFSREITQ